MQLFLQQPAALAHFDNGVIEAIETLRELAGAQPQGRLQIVEMLLLEPVEDDPQARKLPMQADAGSPQAAELLAQIRGAVRQHLLLDLVERPLQPLGNAVHGIGDMLDDGLQQRRHAFDAMAGFERAAGGVDRAQRMMPAADQEPLGHGEAEVAGVFGRLGDVAQQIRDHAVDTVIDGMELLIGVL